jgi:Flp pilus assembly pilin Flp
MTSITIREAWDNLFRDEEGASLVEYILLLVLVAAAAIGGIAALGNVHNNQMHNLGTTITGL